MLNTNAKSVYNLSTVGGLNCAGSSTEIMTLGTIWSSVCINMGVYKQFLDQLLAGLSAGLYVTLTPVNRPLSTQSTAPIYYHYYLNLKGE